MSREGSEVWLEHCLKIKEELFDLSRIAECPLPQWLLDSLLVKLLDGDDPRDCPELMSRFYRGHKNPVKLGNRAFRRWLNFHHKEEDHA